MTAIRAVQVNKSDQPAQKRPAADSCSRLIDRRKRCSMIQFLRVASGTSSSSQRSRQTSDGSDPYDKRSTVDTFLAGRLSLSLAVGIAVMFSYHRNSF